MVKIHLIAGAVSNKNIRTFCNRVAKPTKEPGRFTQPFGNGRSAKMFATKVPIEATCDRCKEGRAKL